MDLRDLFYGILTLNNAGGGAKFQYYKYHNYSVSDTSLRFPWPTEVMEWHFQEPIADIEVRGIQGLVCSEEAEVIVESEIEVFGAPRLVPRLVERSIAQFRVQWAPDCEYCTYKRAEILPSLQPLPPPSSPLIPTPGIYHGIYGSHGLEVFQLERTEETRYQAWKLTGDPYVPAIQISFRFDATSDNIRVGPYNAQRDDPFPTEDGPRPTYGVIFTMYMVISMEQRPVALVIQNAQAQINRNPRTWQPEWVPATIVVYDYNLLDNSRSSTTAFTRGLNESNRCVFSVIFEDEGEDQRHVIDFYRGKFPPANDF